MFFSSDYKISLFDIIYKDKNFDSLPEFNFVMCVNTIPSKAKIMEQYGNKIYFLYQIQHNLYINSYDIKKEINTLDCLRYKIKIKYNNKNINNKENASNNYNFELCKLIDEERFLLINKLNEIIIYNIEKREPEYRYLFINSETSIIDILYKKDILYILYKPGIIIIYNIISKRIQKYKISNQIEKGNLLYIKNEQVIISIKEDEINLVKFFIIKNYLFIKLSEIKIPNEFFAYQYLLSNYNFFYFYAFENNLFINYMNLNKQNDVLGNKEFKNIKYEEYLEIINNLKENIKYLNEEKYEFNSIFLKNDGNKNSNKMTDMIINENLDIMCSFSDGSIMYYNLDIDTRNQTNYIINKIIYKYLIKANFLSINNSIFINNNANNPLIASTSGEQSLKIIDITNCNILNINFEPKNSSEISQKKPSYYNNININKSFTNIFSNYFFSQPMREAKKFCDDFSLPNDINNSSIEVLIYSYFDNNENNNYISIQKIIEYAYNKNKNKKQVSQYIEDICDFFSKKGNINKNLIFDVEINDNIIINFLIENSCYVEALIFIKYKNLGLN